jgi:hypothetical protein
MSPFNLFVNLLALFHFLYRYFATGEQDYARSKRLSSVFMEFIVATCRNDRPIVFLYQNWDLCLKDMGLYVPFILFIREAFVFCWLRFMKPWYFVSWFLDNYFRSFKRVIQGCCNLLQTCLRICFRFIRWLKSRPSVYKQIKVTIRRYYLY